MVRDIVWNILVKSEQALPIYVIFIVLKIEFFKIGLIVYRRHNFIFILMIREASEGVCPRSSMRKGRKASRETFRHGTSIELTCVVIVSEQATPI